MGFPLQVVNSPAVGQQGGANFGFFKTRRDESDLREERKAGGCVHNKSLGMVLEGEFTCSRF